MCCFDSLTFYFAMLFSRANELAEGESDNEDYTPLDSNYASDIHLYCLCS